MGCVVATVLLFVSVRPCLLFCTGFVSFLSQIRVCFIPDCSRFVLVLFPIRVRCGSCDCISLTCVVLYFICTSFVHFGSPCHLFVFIFCRFVALFSSSFARFCHCICAVHSGPVLALLSSCFDSCFGACCHASNCVVMLRHAVFSLVNSSFEFRGN